MKLVAILAMCLNFTHLILPIGLENAPLTAISRENTKNPTPLPQNNELLSQSEHTLYLNALDTQKKISHLIKTLESLQSFLQTFGSVESPHIPTITNIIKESEKQHESLRLSIRVIDDTTEKMDTLFTNESPIEIVIAVWYNMLHNQMHILGANIKTATAFSQAHYHKIREILSDIASNSMQPDQITKVVTNNRNQTYNFSRDQQFTNPFDQIVTTHYRRTKIPQEIGRLNELKEQLKKYQDIWSYFFLKSECNGISTGIRASLHYLHDQLKEAEARQNTFNEEMNILPTKCIAELRAIKREVIKRQRNCPTPKLLANLEKLHTALHTKIRYILTIPLPSPDLHTKSNETLETIKKCFNNWKLELGIIQQLPEITDEPDTLLSTEPKIHHYDKHDIVLRTAEENQALKKQWKYSISIPLLSQMHPSAEQQETDDRLLYLVSNESTPLPSKKKKKRKRYTPVKKLALTIENQPALILFTPEDDPLKIYQSRKTNDFYFYNPEQDSAHMYRVDYALAEHTCIPK